jgi:hypothetical protein
MASTNKPIKQMLADPRVNIPATMLAQAGLSAYGNTLEENQYEKGDGRLILESIMAALGGGAGAVAARRIGRVAPEVIRATVPNRNRVMIRRALANNPEIDRLRQAAPALTAVLASGTGAGFAGGVLAPFIASNLNALGVPSMSGRQQDYYEEDQPAMSQQELAAIAQAIADAS